MKEFDIKVTVRKNHYDSHWSEQYVGRFECEELRVALDGYGKNASEAVSEVVSQGMKRVLRKIEDD